MSIKGYILLPLSIIILCLSPLAHTSPYVPQWVTQGWNQLKNSPDTAISTWQAGLNTLPDEQQLAFLGIYNVLPEALTQLNRVGRDQSAFIVRTVLLGKPVYHVLSAQHITADTAASQQAASTLRLNAGISGRIHTNNASKFKPKPPSAPLKENMEAQEQPWLRVTFESGQSRLTNTSLNTLRAAAKKLLSRDKNQRLLLRGYCDNEPIGGYHGQQQPAHTFTTLTALSQARADSVKQALINAGVPDNNISAKGYGSTAFIGDNHTPDGRNKNRRVDLFLQTLLTE